MPLNFFKCFTSSDSSASNSSHGNESERLDAIKETRLTIEGNDGEFVRLHGNSGFSGIEDSALSADVWQERKSIDYDADSSSSSWALDDSSSASGPVSASRPLHTRSPYVLEERNFRIKGNDGEIDRLCGNLGEIELTRKDWSKLENIEGENAADMWQTRNMLSASDVPKSEEQGKSKVSEVSGLTELTREDSAKGGNGIKGTRPPGLKPPPSMRLPPMDHSCSTSCLFTTSNDDDSSSSTTGFLSSTSPDDGICGNITSWQKGDLLGHGTFGSVYEGITDKGFFFAAREVSLLDQRTMGRQSILQLQQEIYLLSQLKHGNIVRYFGTAKDASNLYIFLELVTKGSLLKLYRNHNLRDSQVSAYTRQILHGLKYLHNRNVIHRDIKCANLLFDTNGSVKLADFGLAKATKLNDVKSCQGIAFWMAPEVVRAEDHGHRLPADIWSLGCTVLEMLTGQFPYAPLDCMEALSRIGMGEPPLVPETLSNNARDFILKCVQVNPDDRPTAAQLLNHPFVRPLPGRLST